MADQEPNPTPDQGGKPDPAKPAEPATPPSPGTEPGKKPDEGGFDPTKIGDEDFNRIFEDNRLYRHPRFKSLSERARQADKLEKERSDAEKKALEEQGKHKELAEKVQAENQDLKQKLEAQAVKNAILAEASKLGIVDVEAAAVLLDRSNIKVGEDGTTEGVKEALEVLLEAKPYLKGNPSTTNPVGSPSNPNPNQTEAGTKKYKLSQLQDAKFFSENEKDIMQALKLGLVEDDIYGSAANAPTPQQT